MSRLVVAPARCLPEQAAIAIAARGALARLGVLKVRPTNNKDAQLAALSLPGEVAWRRVRRADRATEADRLGVSEG